LLTLSLFAWGENVDRRLFDVDEFVSLSADLQIENAVYLRGTEGVIVAVLDHDSYLVSLFPKTERIRLSGDALVPSDAAPATDPADPHIH
jgi:hypothetical protein